MNELVLMAFLGGKPPEPVTITLTSANTSWPVPAGVTSVDLSGKGTSGTSDTTQAAQQDIVNVYYMPNYPSYGTGKVTWDQLQGQDAGIVSDFNADGQVQFVFYYIEVWPDGTNAFYQYSQNITGIPGSGSVTKNSGWKTSGAITASGAMTFRYSYIEPGQPGAAATGFGRTFPGGAPGQAAQATTFKGVAVTPGTNMPVSIPSGGSITVTYYK